VAGVADHERIVDRVAQPTGVPARLQAQIDFVVEADRLKAVDRQNRVLAVDRPENSAEHSWHLALMVVVLAEHADEPIDLGHTVQLAIVHDLVEAYAGDTFVYGDDDPEDQARREAEAADRLFGLLPDDQAAHLRGLWDEFEARETPEARFAKAIGRLQPLLLNFNGRGGTWRAPGVTDAVVRSRKQVIGDASTDLWDYGQQLIELGAERGWVPREGG
jgi:putative hydrolase of HD superfamily